jgi:exopolysaccharide biosynthesis polyprenyl glycosylphosphotransferase
MSKFQRWFSRRVLSESEASAAAPTTNVLWTFPAREARAQSSRDLGHRLIALVFAADLLITFGVLCLSFYLRFNTPISELGINATPDIVDYFGYILLGTVLFVGMLAYGGLYDYRNLLRIRFIWGRILRWSFAWIALLLLGSFALKFQPPLSRVFCVFAWVLTPTLMIVWRSVFHHILTSSVALRVLRQRVAFVGWNHEVERLADNFSRDPESAYEAVGFVREGGSMANRGASIPYLGSTDNIEGVISSMRLDIVILADLNGSRDSVLRLASVCEREMVEFKVVPSYFQILVSGLHLETISGIPILGVCRLPLDQIINRALKRGIDIVGATVGLLLSLPLIAIFGALVYWESPGPIFYRQRRAGRKGKMFDIVKIRSMKMDAEKEGRPGWTVRDDPRRLRIGSLMRRWNIDEIPQFWNVLKGEMSLVGPRPERPELIATFKHDIPHYNARHNAKPGITGWAQVNGLRGNTDLAERIKCDLWYMENWSLMLDFQIMLMTFFKRKNAC